ncbi:MAG: TRAM domain-containing protein [Synergistaceae bacterium]
MSETSLSTIMRHFLKVVMILIFGGIGYQLSKIVVENQFFPSLTTIHPIYTYVFIIIISSLFGLIIAPLFWYLLVKISQFFEIKLQNINIFDLLASLLGLIIGLMLANLIALPMSRIPGSISVYISILLNISFGYLGLRFFSKRRKDFFNLFINFSDIRLKLPKIKKQEKSESDFKYNEEEFSTAKILDTSAIIDGRILDVARTGFLEGKIILPRFILTELQSIADSTDPLRRTKGRRGLSVVAELKKINNVIIEIPETTLKELGRDKVDEALVVMAKNLNGRVVTTDYNLNQVANIEGVFVLNVNDLANSLKPLLLPGENIDIDIIRQGKEHNQGVGYLDDGTMLVIEDGQDSVGERVTVTITSMLQTSAGRMVFGRIK